MVTINIATLKEGTHEIVLEPAAEELELDPERFEDIRVDVTLNYFDGRIIASFTAAALATLECDRTLRLFKQLIRGKYSLLFAPVEDPEQVKDTFEDVRPLDPWDREIDLTESIRDTLLLSVPVRCIAPGAEDLEIQTRYGDADKEIDPRWEALAKLQASRSREE